MITNTLSDYNLWLVGLSVAVSAVGAFVGLTLSRHIADIGGEIRVGWLVLASLVFSCCAIWGMHFFGMLAYQPGQPVSYDIALTALSLLVPIPMTFIGLLAVSRWPRSPAAWLVGGVLMGAGITAMHYTGMAAMRIAAEMQYDPVLLGASIAIAVVVSGAALRMAATGRGRVRYSSGLLMGVAIAGMHYTGMAAMELQPTGAEVDYFSGALTRGTLQWAVGIGVVMAVFVAVVAIIGNQLGELIRDRDNTMGRM